jgi:exonuclease SbcD
VKILAFGDLHLGQGAELGRAPGDRLRDQADVLAQILLLACERDVDAVLVAGDVFEGSTIPPEQLDVFARFIGGCDSAGIPIVAITGNGKHDAAMRDTNGLAIFTHIPGIRVSSTPELLEFDGVTVATLPWVHPGRLIAKHGRDVSRDETNSVVAELLLEAARGLRAQISGDVPAILLAHWSVSGASLPNGLLVDQLRDVILPREELDAVGFDHLVFGHIHKAQEISERGFYVGSPLPLNFGEDTHRHAHGVVIVDTDEAEDVDFHAAEFVPVESRPLVTLDYDFTEHADVEILDLFPPAVALDDAIVRVKYRASSDQARAFDVALLKRELHSLGAAVVRIVPEIVRADRARVEGLDDSVAELDALDRWLDATSYDGDRDRLRDRAARYLEAA